MTKWQKMAGGLLMGGLLAVSAGAQEWKSLFDGKTLEGWTQKNGTATYVVKDGAIIGTTAPKSPNSFLCSNEEYGDFELEFEAKLLNPQLNSGVQIRSQTAAAKGKETYGRVNGPQVEIEASGSKGAEAGYIYGEACGGWMVPKEKLIPHKHFKDDDWNQYRIVAQGARIQTWINGNPIIDITDEAKFKTHPSGFIGLQVHSIGGSDTFQVAWRNIRIKGTPTASISPPAAPAPATAPTPAAPAPAPAGAATPAQ